MRKKLILVLFSAIFALHNTAFADSDITIKYNGDILAFNQKPVIVNNKTLVQLRPIAEAMGLEIDFLTQKGSVILSNSKTTVVFTENSDKIKVDDVEVIMDVPAVNRNDYTFVPVRNLVEPFGDEIDYDGKTKTVTITAKAEDEKIAQKAEDTLKDEQKEIGTGSGKYGHTFFYQSQPELELANNGRGYCWVCSYSMLMSDALAELITPIDVANINIDRGYSGNFMSGHATLVAEFGCELVPALSEDSRYFGGVNKLNKGETALCAATEEEAAAAIREALDNFPYGVIVRFEGYPHSMVAVEYDDENIYFNDPGLKDGEHIIFSETCLKNYKLSDISYIQAIKKKD